MGALFITAWEQRKLGEFIIEFHEKTTVNNQYPILTSSRKGIFLQTDYYSGNQIASKDNTGYNIVPFGYFTYRHMSDDNIFRFNINKIVDKGIVSTLYPVFTTNKYLDSRYLQIQLNHGNEFAKYALLQKQGGSRTYMYLSKLKKLVLTMPNSISEQKIISNFFDTLDNLIALHQRKPFIENGGQKMITSNFTRDSLFKDYFEFWIKLYKEGAVRPVTLEKYRNNQKHITKIIPNLKMKDFDRNAYQELLNQYALTHERQTVIDFHHQVKGAILDAVDDGLIDRDPTRKAIFKGKAPREKKQKYLNQFELHNLLEDLDLGMEITWDWLILLIAKTGLRFSEALGLTPADFDFARQTISVNKTWDYKTNTGFQPTKNRSSIRKVQMDWQLGMQFQHLIKNLNEDEPIFVNGPVCN